MPISKKSGSGGSAGDEIIKVILFCLIVAAAAAFIKWFLGIVMWIWGLVKIGFITAGRVLVCLAALVILCFIIALICDALAPLVRRWKKDRARRLAMSRCRLPDINTFRTGRSSRDGEAGKIDAFMSSLLRTRYYDLTGSFPDRFTFRNNMSAYAAFKKGELPAALLSARSQIEQDLFAPLIAAYRTSDSHQNPKE